jgi:hypothetical protein
MYGVLPFLATRLQFLLDRYAESAHRVPLSFSIPFRRSFSMDESCLLPFVILALSMMSVDRAVIMWGLTYLFLLPLPFLMVNHVSYLLVEKPDESTARLPF